MITKVVHGWRPAGLLAYLFGPGVSDVHRDPRVIASWDGRDAGWQPERVGPSEHDLALGPLIDALQAPAVAAGLPLRAPAGAGRGYVWHLSVRCAEQDRVLDDGEWTGVVRELLHDAGIAERDDAGGPRWFAVRHASDHVHVAVVLVRQDELRRFWPHQDYPRLRASARRIEDRLGLTATGAAGEAIAQAPSRGERARAEREHAPPARARLRHRVRKAALQASDLDTFVARLEASDVLVEVRRGPSGDALGYAVALCPDLLDPSEPVFFSGSKLAADLSLPRLQQRWDEGAGRHRAARVLRPHVLVNEARLRMEAGRVDPARVAAAVGDVLVAIAASSQERDADPWRAAADDTYRVAIALGGTRLSRDPSLLGLARQLLRSPGVRRDDGAAGVALAVALAALLVELGRFVGANRRARDAAGSAAERVRTAPVPSPGTASRMGKEHPAAAHRSPVAPAREPDLHR